MTQIISFVSYGAVQQLTDRLLSSYAKRFDDSANKNVVLFARDAVVAIAYTGTAFISRSPGAEKIPTDQWIVEMCTGETIPRDGLNGEPTTRLGFGSSPEPSFDLGNMLVRLCRAVNDAFANGSVDSRLTGSEFEIVVAGWRCGKKRSRPILCRVARWPASDPFNVSWSRRHLGRGFLVGIDPPHTARHVDKTKLDAGFAACRNADDVTCVLADAVRGTSEALPQHVGSDVMSVLLPPPQYRRVRIEYLAASTKTTRVHKMDVRFAYSPWIVAPQLRSPPQRIAGSWQLHAGSWLIDIVGFSNRGYNAAEAQQRKRLS